MKSNPDRRGVLELRNRSETGRAPPAHLQRPVLHLQRRHAVEFAPVLGDDHQPLAACVRGDMQVVDADGRARQLERGADLPVVLRRLRPVGSTSSRLQKSSTTARLAAGRLLFSAPCISSASVMAETAMRPACWLNTAAASGGRHRMTKRAMFVSSR